MKQIFRAFLIFSLAVACTAEKKSDVTHPQAVTIMAYNVENLFDTEDDPKINDETYLPLSLKRAGKYRAICESMKSPWYKKSCLETDWNKSKLEQKMQRIADVVLRVKDGTGPDVLILEEVENVQVLEDLRKNFLSKAGYKKAILLEGPDKRGIDVGMLSRLPQVGEARLHQVALTPKGELTKDRVRPTRGILHSKFMLTDGTVLNVMGVHFPSQANPTESRRQAINLLNKIGNTIPTTELVVVGGDFNISAKEEAETQLYKKELGQNWQVSHLVGCKDCVGTHNYKGEWSFLDALLFSNNLITPDQKTSWKVVTSSIRVSTLSPYQTDPTQKIPARFEDGNENIGVSDHWPIVAEIIPTAE